MARSNDLVPLFTAQDNGPAVGFRQGTVVFWNPDTGENQILVGDSLMTNLPFLNSTEANLLKAGDVVGIQTAGKTWAIVGRFTIPGTPEAVSAIQSVTNRIQAAEDSSSGYRTNSAYGDLTGAAVGPSATVRIGSSGRAVCWWSAEIGQVLNTGGFITYQTRNTPHVGVEVSGANSIAANDWNALNFDFETPSSEFDGYALSQFWLQAGTHHLFTGLNPGQTTFTLKYRTDTITPNNRAYFSAREIVVFAL